MRYSTHQLMSGALCCSLSNTVIPLESTCLVTLFVVAIRLSVSSIHRAIEAAPDATIAEADLLHTLSVVQVAPIYQYGLLHRFVNLFHVQRLEFVPGSHHNHSITALRQFIWIVAQLDIRCSALDVLGCNRIVSPDIGSLLVQHRRDVHGWRFTDIVRVLLEGEAKQRDCFALDGAEHILQLEHNLVTLRLIDAHHGLK